MNVLRTEQAAEGKYDVYTTDDYPNRVGFITGGNSKWLAERGQFDLGYHKTMKTAVNAIAKELELERYYQ